MNGMLIYIGINKGLVLSDKQSEQDSCNVPVLFALLILYLSAHEKAKHRFHIPVNDDAVNRDRVGVSSMRIK